MTWIILGTGGSSKIAEWYAACNLMDSTQIDNARFGAPPQRDVDFNVNKFLPLSNWTAASSPLARNQAQAFFTSFVPNS